MAQQPTEEKIQRNLEFYQRWRIDGEELSDLLTEYDISYPRAYQIKKQVEERPQYSEARKEIGIV